MQRPTEARVKINGKTHLWCDSCKKWFDISEQPLREIFMDHKCFEYFLWNDPLDKDFPCENLLERLGNRNDSKKR